MARSRLVLRLLLCPEYQAIASQLILRPLVLLGDKPESNLARCYGRRRLVFSGELINLCKRRIIWF